MKFKVYYKINNTFNNHLGGSDQVDSSEIMDLNKISEDKVIKLEQQLISKFLCPVTNKIMKDPVIGSNGITFDRNSIENENFNKILNLKNENLISNKSLKELIEFSINEGLIDILKTKEYFNEKYIDLLNNIKNNFDTIPDIFKKETINFIKIDDNGNILINFNNESNILINTNNNVSRDDEKSSKILDKTEEIIDDFSKKLNKSKYKNELINYVYDKLKYYNDRPVNYISTGKIAIHENDRYIFLIEIIDGYQETEIDYLDDNFLDQYNYSSDEEYDKDNEEYNEKDDPFFLQHKFKIDDVKYTIKFNKYDKSSRRGYNISKVKAYDINSSIERLEYFENKYFNNLDDMLDEIIFLHNTVNKTPDEDVEKNINDILDLDNLQDTIYIDYHPYLVPIFKKIKEIFGYRAITIESNPNKTFVNIEMNEEGDVLVNKVNFFNIGESYITENDSEKLINKIKDILSEHVFFIHKVEALRLQKQKEKEKVKKVTFSEDNVYIDKKQEITSNEMNRKREREEEAKKLAQVEDKDLADNFKENITINYDNNENLKALNVLINLYPEKHDDLIAMLYKLYKEDFNFIKNNIYNYN